MTDNPVTLPELSKALDNLIAETLPPLLGKDEVTIMQVLTRLGCTYKSAVKQLQEWTDAGRVEFVGERLVKGKRAKAWKVITK